ncbi:L,D-transpeptidase family protein [Litoreibacter janthinus]|uniref:Murein L,D-transpeptidase YcbB/YkuD n=1 Tax=Litoreibacter janthinus TaxID=670154 RepID=A0A1I6H2S3_9RHOB|nr:L,D-transpeptidase family protein [Litoreibacter janthinus]SFR48702.1 Murein L,D-transpeptidase YcbB/YkuD [Litoreibacter janthinus]
MTRSPTRRLTLKMMAAGAASFVLPNFGAGQANAAVTALKQSIAEAAARDEALSAFYRERNYKPVFVGNGDGRRRGALLKALASSGDHGLPTKAYDADGLKAAMKAARTPSDQGRVEVQAAQRFLDYADHMRSGVLNPRSVDSSLVMDVPRYDRASTIDAFSKSNPAAFLKKMAPRKAEYVRLQKEKMNLEKLLGKGGWGEKIQAKSLKPGQSGGAVVQLRNRMIRMGYMRKSASQTYDAAIQSAVQQFQVNHGLAPDGVAGASTIAQINTDVQERLQQVLVAMERQRWNSRPTEKKHVWVNIPDFHVDIMNNGKSTFRSRVVVGKNTSDRRTPEFSDTMEFMVINPSWYVPRSIVTKEYLPLLKRNKGAAGQLQIIGSNGRPVNRANINFAQYNERNFPYSMKQPPSKGNALGLVKFMFPNKYNIYLHDTPSKSLFGRESRAFSHGCVRVHKPFDFAYALLANQEKDPEGFFQGVLRTKQERRVDLREPLPVHIVYYTAWVDAKGRAHYRDDVYNRDARIFAGLSRAGVSLRSVAS